MKNIFKNSFFFDFRRSREKSILKSEYPIIRSRISNKLLGLNYKSFYIFKLYLKLILISYHMFCKPPHCVTSVIVAKELKNWVWRYIHTYVWLFYIHIKVQMCQSPTEESHKCYCLRNTFLGKGREGGHRRVSVNEAPPTSNSTTKQWVYNNNKGN